MSERGGQEGFRDLCFRERETLDHEQTQQWRTLSNRTTQRADNIGLAWLRGDSNVAGQRINGYYAMGKAYKEKLAGSTERRILDGRGMLRTPLGKWTTT